MLIAAITTLIANWDVATQEAVIRNAADQMLNVRQIVVWMESAFHHMSALRHAIRIVIVAPDAVKTPSVPHGLLFAAIVTMTVAMDIAKTDFAI